MVVFMVKLLVQEEPLHIILLSVELAGYNWWSL